MRRPLTHRTAKLARASALAFFACGRASDRRRRDMTKLVPDYTFETAAMTRGFARIAGVDEVGRGPLAGPVTAAAVVLDPSNIPDGLNDSKVLTSKKREGLFDIILSCADVSIAHATVDEIDELNILRASHLAMERAVAGLATPPDHVLIDGNMTPRGLTLPSETIIKGDARSVSISAASIIAKITRDRIMVDLAQQFPGYGWETNAGYPSKSHRLALQNLGVTPHHRRSFKPVHNILYQQENVSD
ncbi:ribonuclease HII [Aliiroseovarius sediminilitoris]